MIDIQQKKQKIISFLKINGPSLPVRIAKIIEMDPVFASAILSELISEKTIKTSHIKIGSSPLYLLPDQDQKLEDQTSNLKPIEQDAIEKLKEKKLITDEDEEPAIRVALRNIKDFATPFKFQDKIMWRYTFAPKEEVEKILSLKPTINDRRPTPSKPHDSRLTTHDSKLKIEPIFKTPQTTPTGEALLSAKRTISEADYQRSELSAKRTNPPTFLKKIEEFLEKQNTQIISIEEVDKKKVIAKIKSESQTALLFAFNKKRITEDELMKCYKKTKTLNLPYYIITSGEPTKKMTETIDAYKKLIKIDNLKP